jgi:hypothetical protein
MFLRCCIISDPLVLILILIFCISSYFHSTSRNYINLFPIIYSFLSNPLNILVIMIPFSLYFCQNYKTFFFSMIYCMIIHACGQWLRKIPYIMMRFLEIVACYWSSTSSKSSSSFSSYVSFIVCAQSIIPW